MRKFIGISPEPCYCVCGPVMWTFRSQRESAYHHTIGVNSKSSLSSSLSFLFLFRLEGSTPISGCIALCRHKSHAEAGERNVRYQPPGGKVRSLGSLMRSWLILLCHFIRTFLTSLLYKLYGVESRVIRRVLLVRLGLFSASHIPQES